jgi:hypothetical protein
MALEMDDGLPCSVTLQGLRLRIVEASRTFSADRIDLAALGRRLRPLPIGRPRKKTKPSRNK